MNKNYLDKAGIEATIKRIVVAGKELDKDIQEAGVGCLNHIEQHGDVTLFNRLYLALPKGARKSALTAWGLAFGKLQANTGDNKKELPFVYAKDKETNLGEAQAKPWYDFSPDKAPDEVFDALKALNALIAKMGKASEVKNPEVAEKLRALAEEFTTEE